MIVLKLLSYLSPDQSGGLTGPTTLSSLALKTKQKNNKKNRKMNIQDKSIIRSNIKEIKG